MNFATPWRPSLFGNLLAKCTLVQDLEEYDVVPNSRRETEAKWSISSIKREFEGAKEEAKVALQESVIAIWRLREMQADGIRDQVWKDHMVAWMVRHRFLPA